ncbi:MAG: Veg protein [Firmicutes bacterium]|nr:Veg protein [Bacillota bacterium]
MYTADSRKAKVSIVPANNNSIEQIKLNLDACVGKKIRLKANKGRKKVVEAEGILENTYPNIFVIRLDKSSAVKRLSYTYADVLTQTVELTVYDHQAGAACGTAESM